MNAGESITISGLPAGAVVAPSNPFTANTTGGFAITVAVPSSLASYNISFAGAATTKTLHNVLFGHTILCSGQSKFAPVPKTPLLRSTRARSQRPPHGPAPVHKA